MVIEGGVAATKSSSSFVVVLPTSPRRSKLPTPPRRSKLREAMSDKPGGYVGQDFGELSRAAVLEGELFPAFANFQKSDRHSE